ncbi:MAG: isocitrate/isopropylmalate dehydrogenase family protein, partial [Calditrichaeota bacterium]|nr:isocitrate/isopropylmalate dehydrogenase family protein [Calditrichota bacterium]
DLYAGVEFHPVPEAVMKTLLENHPKMARFKDVPLNQLAISLRIVTEKAATNISKQAFDYAQKHGYKSVTIVEKPNVVRETSGMMVRQARKVAEAYDTIELWEANIDAMTMWLVKNPQKYDVLVASNLFGDIISDLAAQLVGGLGFACSGNIGDDYAVFEPTHGSAPKYAGQYKVNPTAMILSVKMMLDYLGETEKARRLEAAVARVIKEGKVKTYDMGGINTTLEMGEEIARNYQSL